MNGSKAVVAFLAGVALGAAFGVLFAPYEGAETRQRVSDGARNLGNKLGSLKDKATGKINEFLRHSEEEAEAAKG